jgi:hypothetical protein
MPVPVYFLRAQGRRSFGQNSVDLTDADAADSWTEFDGQHI